MATERKPRPVGRNPAERAIDNYFADLLSDVPETPPRSARVVELRPALRTALPPVIAPETLLEPLLVTEPAGEEIAVPETEALPAEVATPAAEMVEDSHPPTAVTDRADETLLSEPEREAVPPATGRQHAPTAVEQQNVAADPLSPHQPDWANEPFQCLMFMVDNVRMAVPLQMLDSITEWQGRLNTIPGQPAWCLGVLRHRGNKVVVLDTGRLLMPERVGNAPRPERGQVLIVGGGRWGLACDHLQRPEWLAADAVKWRPAGAPRPWIAGTVKEKLCPLLAVDELLAHLGR